MDYADGAPAVRVASPSLVPACRDLISSADTIVDMARTCDSVLGNIKGVQVRIWYTKSLDPRYQGLQVRSCDP